MANATNLYFKLPIPLQNAATYLAALKIKRERYGAPFSRIFEEYKQRSSWTADHLQSYQNERLQKMIAHCYETVPYYRRLFDELDLNPNSIKNIDDLSILPVLTKDDVRKCPEDFLSSEYKVKKVIHRHTSGSTGSAFQFVMNKEAVMEQWAVAWRYWENLGIRFNAPHAMFGTRRIASPKQEKPPFWRSKAPVGEGYFSAFHESEDNLQSYFDEINRRGYSWIHGYPSLITPLAAFMVEKNLRFSKPIEHLTLAAENLLPYQRNLMFEAFEVEPRMHYASTEGVANASQLAYGDDYYIDEDYAILEVVKDGINSERGEIVGTTLTNFAMPLLRWKLNDLATLGKGSDGRRLLKSIDGRAEDYILLPSGVRLGKLDHVFKDTNGIREAQIRQASDYSIEILAVAIDSNKKQDEEIAMRELRESGCDLPVRFRYVDFIPKTESGKLRFVVSEAQK